MVLYYKAWAPLNSPATMNNVYAFFFPTEEVTVQVMRLIICLPFSLILKVIFSYAER